MLRYLPLLFCLSLSAQFGVKYWKPVGVGNTAARPSTCTANRDTYINTQTTSIDYCTAANTWTALVSSTSGTVTSVDASGGVETSSGSAITGSGTIRGGIVVNAQTGTTYTVLTGDRGKLVTHTNASSIAVTLPQAGGSFPANWYYMAQNRGAGTATITPTTSTIDGAASLALTTGQGAIIVSDGTNYFTMRGINTVTGGVTTGVTLTADLPVIGAGGSAVAIGTRQGNTTKYTTYAGSAPATNDCAKYDANGNLTTAGAACGSGGGSTMGYGAYASLPGTCTTGDRYLTSDSIYEFACTASNTWSAFWRGTKITLPPTSSWSWYNQGSSSVATSLGYITLTAQATASDNLRGYIRSVTAPYTVTALVQGVNLSSGTVGVIFKNSGGNAVVIATLGTNKIEIVRYTNSTTFSSLTSTLSGTVLPNPVWVQMVDDNTNRIVKISADGTNWTTAYSEARTNHITADQVGIYTNNNSTTLQAQASLISWAQ